VIEGRPAEDVELPDGLKKDKRPRAILSDAEIAKHLGAAKCDLEIKMLALTATGQRASGSAAIHGPKYSRSTIRIHSGLTTHGLGTPSVSVKATSHARPRA
jgi:hypothetical protein